MANPNDTARLSKDEALEKLRGIRKRLRITKITCTRSVKGRGGDSFVGFSAAWQSVQDDVSGPGADVQSSREDDAVYAEQGMTIKEAKLARYMLSMECDLAALESAAANGSITPAYFGDAVKGVQNNYNQLILREMGILPDDGNNENQ